MATFIKTKVSTPESPIYKMNIGPLVFMVAVTKKHHRKNWQKDAWEEYRISYHLMRKFTKMEKERFGKTEEEWFLHGLGVANLPCNDKDDALKILEELIS